MKYERGNNDYAGIAQAVVDGRAETTEVTADEYWDMLECLPPIYTPGGGFLVSEAITGSILGAIYSQYCEHGGRFFAKYVAGKRRDTYITVEEMEQAIR